MNNEMIEKISWAQAQPIVKKLLPEFAAIIDALNLSGDFYLYRVKYPYGAVIVDHGVFQVPNKNGDIVPLSDSTIDGRIQKDLGYSGTIPLGLVTENSIESYLFFRERLIPSTFTGCGKFVSLWRVLEEGYSYHTGRFWNIVSGARSLCMVPKITDSVSHREVNKYFGLNHSIPQKLVEQWELFVKIARHPKFSTPWQSTLLFFPAQWFAHKKDPAWVPFYYHLLNTVWQSPGTAYKRNKFIFDVAFSSAQENRNLRPNPYLADTVEHLIAMSLSAMPGFAPAIDDSAAPITGLQRVYSESYELKKYAPVFLHSHHFSVHESRPVYYSFQFPTTMSFSPKSRKDLSLMSQLQEVRHIAHALLLEITNNKLEIENTHFSEIVKKAKFEFYHSDEDIAREILPAHRIAEVDGNFTKSLIYDRQYTFPEFSPFFKGCAMVSKQ